MQIKITDIAPFLRKGYVAMDMNGTWWWRTKKPRRFRNQWSNDDFDDFEYSLNAFDIAPADDWTQSLIKVGGK